MIELKYELKQANASLDEIIELFTEMNTLYRNLKDKDASDEIITLVFDHISFPKEKLKSDYSPNISAHEPLRREENIYVHLTSDPINPRNLTGRLENQNGIPLESVSLSKHKCAQTVKEIGRELTKKYGRPPLEELQGKYQQEFVSLQDEDYGYYEFLILDFFLKNLYLFK
ncbi:hypothetical protein GOV12_01315 [Candidatus Pacearchaeota archaeon]|nr:hypothetical protein [Candidatus Pacearchaeota archaeon]